ncbi:Protein MHF1 [Glycine soja]
MESVDANSEVENDAEMKLLRDKFRLSAISIIESQVPNSRIRQRNYAAKQNGMEVSKVVVTCVADLAFKYTERLARDLHLFAQHANRKSVNMEDVILCGHRNEHVSGMLRSFSNDLKAKDPQSEKKRKKEPKKNDKGTT